MKLLSVTTCSYVLLRISEGLRDVASQIVVFPKCDEQEQFPKNFLPLRSKKSEIILMDKKLRFFWEKFGNDVKT